MFREMRRKKQQLSKEQTIEILLNNTSGVLCLLGDDDYPYPVPMSYVYKDNHLYFHSATTGHKIDAIRKHTKASFCVIDQDQVVAQELTTYFRSAIIFGTVQLLEGDQKRQALFDLGYRYLNDSRFIQEEIERFFNQCTIIDFKIEHYSGKVAKELL